MKNLRMVLFGVCGMLFLLYSCSPARNGYRRAGRQIEKDVRNSPVFNRAFTGFTLLDPETGRSLADVNGDHFFTPASTTKILTMYTSLKVLGDSVPGLQVQRLSLNEDEHRSVLLVRGTGDPTFLHPQFQHWQSPFGFLKSTTEPIQMLPRQLSIDRFGPGWAWDDYGYGFQPERSIFPMYGNVVLFIPKDGNTFDVYPPFFKSHFHPTFLTGGAGQQVTRKESDNQWFVPADITTLGEKRLPFTTVERAALLSDTLGKYVEDLTGFEYEYVPPHGWQTLYSTPLDTVLRRMMHQSDNFIAEQLLLVSAGQKFGRMEPDTLIKWVLDSVLSDLPQRPRWVDGSGLTRYNLITPQDLSTVLLHLWREVPHETLLPLFPAGGVDGTLADWYGGKDGKPYVFAKSGSMSGVTCLSGFVRTRRGKMLIFTFMTNHFVGSSRDWKVEMQRILERIGN
jgi:D-alanyl-D-alanine carboxypeptidase/D-alanyl-D-alanine-endopeptidase (penicillin-binding protein 4)